MKDGCAVWTVTPRSIDEAGQSRWRLDDNLKRILRGCGSCFSGSEFGDVFTQQSDDVHPHVVNVEFMKAGGVTDRLGFRLSSHETHKS